MEWIGDDDTFRIFISHKHEDHGVARALKDALGSLSGEYAIEAFVSGSDIPAGADWNSLLRAELGRSHMLILLFTNPSRNWDWCLYEAGLFTRFDREQARAVVCLYDPGSSPPSPLKGLQGVPVRERKIETFLARLCKTTWEVADDWKRGPLNAGIEPKAIASAAQTICDSFQHGTYAYHPCHRVVLDLTAVGKIGDRIPEEAHVVEGPGATSAFTLSIFGVAEGARERTWGDLLEGVEGREADWRRQLDEVFCAALREELFEPVTAPLRSWQQNRDYRPILYRIERAREQVDEAKAADEVGEKDESGQLLEVVIVFEGSVGPEKER